MSDSHDGGNERLSDLELSREQERLFGLVSKTPSPGKHAGRSAVMHLQRAWCIRDIDKEMALFRGLTAEEEAARAIFHALQRRQYSGSGKLKWRNHKHKSALVPFLHAVGIMLGEIKWIQPKVVIDGDERLWVEFLGEIDGSPVEIRPIPPLDGRALIDGKEHSFRKELDELITSAGATDFDRFLHDRVTERNNLLYASDQGVLRIEGSVEEELRHRVRNVFSLLTLYLLVDGHPEHQGLVVQLLTAFLALLPRAKGTDEG